MDKIERRSVITSASEEAKYLVSCGFLANGREWISAWYNHDLKWSDEGSGYVTIPIKSLDNFVLEARRSPEVFSLAKFVVGTRMEQQAEVPEPLRTLMSDYLKGVFPVPKGKKGRKRNWGRDTIIIRVMNSILLSQDIPATANLNQKGAKNRTESASELMVEALKDVPEIGHMDRARIQKIWGSREAPNESGDAYGMYLVGMLEDEEELVRI